MTPLLHSHYFPFNQVLFEKSVYELVISVQYGISKLLRSGRIYTTSCVKSKFTSKSLKKVFKSSKNLNLKLKEFQKKALTFIQ